MATTTATPPTVTSLRVILEHDPDSNPFDMRTRFHWERFGQKVEIDDSEYHSLSSDHRFDFDDEDHPIYTLQKGAKLVIEDSMRYSNEEATKYSVKERLAWLSDDAKLIRTWLENQWHYVTLHVEATVTTTVTGHEYTDTEDEYLGGIEDGLGGLDPAWNTPTQEREYHRSTAHEMIDTLKAQLTQRGIVWPENLEADYDAQ